MNKEVENKIIYNALISRRVEESFLDLFYKGKISGTVHTCIGQEFSGAVICSYLNKGDSVFSNHRCHGHFLSFVGDVDGLVAEIMGKQTGVCGGKGGSQHLCKDGFYSNGIQGGIAATSLGLALSRKVEKKQKISAVFMGDGTLGEGAVYEAFNIASKWKLPLLFILENNKIAQSTPSSLTLAGDILARAKSFGIDCAHVNTWDWKEMYSISAKLIHSVRSEERPGFLLVDTFRLKAHSKGDDTRSRAEVEPYEKKDPLNIVLMQESKDIVEIKHKVEVAVQSAIARGDTSRVPQWEGKSPAQKELETIPADQWSEYKLPAHYIKKRLGVALNEAFKLIMKASDKVFFIGEDVMSPYGGAFKIADGLSDLFPGRVFTTPISEQSIIGISNGLALAGYRPFAEIMFGDFMTLALDQILNHAAKFEDMYNGQVEVNIVVRTPMGGGRGYGPTHSQSIEKHFLGIPGLRVLALSHLLDPATMLQTLATQHIGATLLVENKKAYAAEMCVEPPIGYLLKLNQQMFPTIHLEPQSPIVDVSILAYGGMTDLVIQAVEVLLAEHDIVAQAIFPTQIYPFSVDTCFSILNRASHLLVVEEGQMFGSFSSEVIAQLFERGFSASVKRLAPPEVCIPASAALEKQILPSVDLIVHTILGMLQ